MIYEYIFFMMMIIGGVFIYVANKVINNIIEELISFPELYKINRIKGQKIPLKPSVNEGIGILFYLIFKHNGHIENNLKLFVESKKNKFLLFYSLNLFSFLFYVIVFIFMLYVLISKFV